MNRSTGRCLDVLVRMRRQREDLAAQDLATMVRQAEEIRRDMEGLDRSLAEHNRLVRRALAGGRQDIAEVLEQYRRAVRDVGAVRKARQEQMDQIAQPLRQKRAKLVEAIAQRKAMSGLKDKLARVAAASSRRQLVRELDDLHAAHQAGGQTGADVVDHADDKLAHADAGEYASADERHDAPQPSPSQGAAQGMQPPAGMMAARVELGRQWLDARKVYSLGSGSVVELSADADDEVDISVSGTVAAHGELVVVGGRYGVRITQRAAGAKGRFNA